MKPTSQHRAVAVAALVCVLLCASDTGAQGKDAPKVEVGVQFSTLELNPPESFFFGGTETRPGFGGRITYNLNDHLAVEAEGNFFPAKGIFGRNMQAQMGVKAGKRFEKFGVFAKARPGLVSFDEMPTLVRVPNPIFSGIEFRQERKTFFTTDVGGVLELYPSRRTVVRFDAGDTIIRYSPRLDFNDTTICCDPLRQRPAEYKHNFQLSAGIGFRFMDSGGDRPSAPSASDDDGGDVPTVEVGIQYSSLSLNTPVEFEEGGVIILSTRARANGNPSASFDRLPPVTARQVLANDRLITRGDFTEPAVGGRLTVNLNRSIALETVANFFTKENFISSRYGGRAIQGLFGVKIGKRFERFGIFGKARPGFISYSDVNQLQGTRNVTALGRQVVVGLFGTERKTYFNADVGGVLEFYPSRRIVARFDAGDTIIRYDATQIPVIDFPAFVNGVVFDLPAETRHNFQFTAGIGYRF